MVLHHSQELIQVSGIVFLDDLVFIDGNNGVYYFVVDVQFRFLPCNLFPIPYLCFLQ
jgi:hypothetical protein